MRFTRTISEGEREPLATSRMWVIGLGMAAVAIILIGLISMAT